MCAFNALNGVPACGNRYLLTDILKGEWGFDGFVESDWTAVTELRACPPRTPDSGECGHGVAADGPAAAALALNAGVDSEMTSTVIRDFGEELLAKGEISMSRINDAVRRILRVKMRAGLFEHPYAPYPPDQAEAQMLLPDAVAAARSAASRSMVLLKNEGSILPLDPAKRTAVIGPLAKNQHDLLGPWWGRGEDGDVITVFDGIAEQSTAETTYAEGCKLSNMEVPLTDPEGCAPTPASPRRWRSRRLPTRSSSRSGDAGDERRGELPQHTRPAGTPGEADRGDRGDRQAVRRSALQRPAARARGHRRRRTRDPGGVVPRRPGGPAVADVVFGSVNPGGKLPVSFPYRVGQVPIYYNHERTGRPCNKTFKWNSQHRDIPSCSPLFEFGFGLSYTTFSITNLRLSGSSVPTDGSITASVDVENTGTETGDEVVQLYLHDPVASISQPVRRLRGFERVTLAPGEKRTVTFTLDKSDFGFYDNHGKFVVEPGQIDVYAGNSSSADLVQSFTVVH